MKVRVTIELDLDLPKNEEKNPFLSEVLYDYVLGAAKVHHLIQACEWCPGGKNHTESIKNGGGGDEIFKTHKNWGKILGAAKMDYELIEDKDTSLLRCPETTLW